MIMIKKTLGLVLLMILLSSCFVKLDDKEAKSESNVMINLSNVSRITEEGYYEKIVVILENLTDGKLYEAVASREAETKKDMVLENIPYGNYSVTIKIYSSGATDPYSIINSELNVGKEVATFEGVVGGPNQAKNLSGSLEYYEDGDYYVDFECDKVTSNYVSDTTGDTITYKLYGSIYEDFRDIDLEKPLIEINPLDDPLERHPKNKTTDKDKVVFKLGKFSSSDPEIPSGIINDRKYYWKVVTCATVKGIERISESDVQSVLCKKKVVNNLPNKVTSIIAPVDGETDWQYSYGFSWEPVTSVSNNASYNNITYKLHISQDNFVDASKTKILNQQSNDPSGGWFQSNSYIVTEDTSIEYGQLRATGYFTTSTTYYWRVEATNSAGSSMSDTFIVTHN
jgi:hypothetical protein